MAKDIHMEAATVKANMEGDRLYPEDRIERSAFVRGYMMAASSAIETNERRNEQAKRLQAK
jgi:hypothetical protein